MHTFIKKFWLTFKYFSNKMKIKEITSIYYVKIHLIPFFNKNYRTWKY